MRAGSRQAAGPGGFDEPGFAVDTSVQLSRVTNPRYGE
ncbi:hypothetical protein C791_6289 [Amycolatopsis azurea DSM 43854]|uniref:Uncharacterized protein n=1 Tax=Amycolatopsis azurea DSM 43854 TaxID=1238180 RepID=M2QBS7_9PSEU|nr:hypothetical protein C791_6289 [Amycolatopsis azurea DSM 43854]